MPPIWHQVELCSICGQWMHSQKDNHDWVYAFSSAGVGVQLVQLRHHVVITSTYNLKNHYGIIMVLHLMSPRTAKVALLAASREADAEFHYVSEAILSFLLCGRVQNLRE